MTLDGTVVAYEEFFTTASRYTLEGEAVTSSLSVILVVKSNRSVAWIAEDTERSATAKAAYFDLYEVDTSGTRLLASGTDIDPSLLALSAGATRLGYYPDAIVGTTLYWTQGGRSFSTTLS